MNWRAPEQTGRWRRLRGAARRVGSWIPSPLPPAAVLVVAVVALLAIAILVPPVGILGVTVFIGAWVVRAKLWTVLIAYLVVLFLIPARYTIGPFALNAAMLLAFLAGFLWIGSKLLPYVSIPRGANPITIAMFAFFCLMLLNYGVTHTTPLTLFQIKNADRLLALLFSGTILGAAFVDGVRTRAQMYRVMSTMVGMGSVVAFIGIIQFLTGLAVVDWLHPPGFKSLGINPIEHRAGFPRVGGTASHPIEMGVVWAVLLPLALHLARFAPTRRGRRMSFAATGLLLLAVPMAGSRSGFAAAAVAMMIVASRWTFRRQANMLGGVLVAGLFVTMLSPGLLGAMGKLVSGEAGKGSIEGRKQANEQALEVSAKHPWWGLGFGTLTTGNEGGAVITVNEGFTDNMWIEALLTTGWIGVAGLAVFFVFSAFVGLTARARAPDRALRDLGLTLAAVVLAIAISGWGLSLLQYPMLLGVLYVTLGCIGALFRIVSTRDEDGAPPVSSLPALQYQR